MRIIPAIDIIDGKCVRLTKGDYATSKIYNESPLEVAKMFEDHGITYLHVVDLDGAKSKRMVNQKTLETLCTKTSLKVDFGGGLKTKEDVKKAIESGANQVTLGSVAISRRDFFVAMLEEYGNEVIILGADALDRKVAIAGWQEQTSVDVVQLIQDYETLGSKYVISTDIAKDGMLQGPSIELYKDILKEAKVDLIASGGISNIGDVEAVKDIGCEGVIIGKAIYEGRITIQQLAALC